MAIKEIYGDDSLSYHHLSSYKNQLVNSNPNSYVVLQKHPDTKIPAFIVSFGSCIAEFNHCYYHCCSVIFLDGMLLKARHQVVC